MTERYKNRLIELITKHLPHTSIYLYGSRARKDHREGSDVDLALDNKKKIGRSIISDIKEDLEESTIPLFVDVVDVHDVSSEFLKEIKKDWIQWN